VVWSAGDEGDILECRHRHAGDQTHDRADIARQRQRPHWPGVRAGVTRRSRVSGRATRPRLQPRLHPGPVEQRQSQPMSTPAIGHVLPQIFVAGDRLGALESIAKALVPRCR
jgi:hypothetical protein